MWKILILLFLPAQALAVQGPIIWGSNNNAVYLPTNRPTVGLACLAIDPLGVMSAQTCSAGSGSVTSVAWGAVPSWLTAVGGPITTFGTLGLSVPNQAANLFLASPNGVVGPLAPRAIVAADLPAAVTGAVVPIVGNYTSSVSGEFIIANCAVLCTVTLPDISATNNYRVSMKNIGTAHAIFHNQAGQLIDGVNDWDLFPNKSHVNLISSGGQWYVY
jgi:hypothetical protein